MSRSDQSQSRAREHGPVNLGQWSFCTQLANWFYDSVSIRNSNTKSLSYDQQKFLRPPLKWNQSDHS